jgi:hypothetical protein
VADDDEYGEENAHGALLSRREDEDGPEPGRGLAEARYSHAAAGAYEAAGESLLRAVTRGHGADHGGSRREPQISAGPRWSCSGSCVRGRAP